MRQNVQGIISASGIGALAGLIGGIAFGAGMVKLGAIRMIAALVGSESVVVAWSVHLLISAVIGAVFGLLFYQQTQRLGTGLVWGMTYGLLWWFLGPLTGMPVLLGKGLNWSLEAIRPAFPSLINHLVFGFVLGGSFVLLWKVQHPHPRSEGRRIRKRVVAFVLGGVAGLIALLIYRIAFGAESVAVLSQVFALSPRWSSAVGIVILLGGVFGLLFEETLTGHGSSLAWGLMFGFTTWALMPLTVLPLVGQAALRWSLTDAGASISGLVGLLLFSALMAVVFFTLTRLRRALFSDEIVRARADDGLGPRSVRAVGWGVMASVAGGIAFSVVMVWMDLLPTVAGLVGLSSAVIGFVVHMVISAIIGATYGLLFRREATTLGAGIAWGLVYGFLWWLLGPLTLMPRILGQGTQWSVAAAHAAFPSLVGHLAYGAATALVFQVLANRYELGDRLPGAQPGRPVVVTEASAVWAFILMLGLVLPLLLIP